MLNPIEQAIRHLLARIIIEHFEILLRTHELTQIFSLVHQSEPHKTRSSFNLCFKNLKIYWLISLRSNLGAKWARNTRGVTHAPPTHRGSLPGERASPFYLCFGNVGHARRVFFTPPTRNSPDQRFKLWSWGTPPGGLIQGKVLSNCNVHKNICLFHHPW